MVFINEFLPNPDGADSGEWIELLNNGNKPVYLLGWFIKTANGKKTELTGSVAAGGYKIFKKQDYKFMLRNVGESITLYDCEGNRGFQSWLLRGGYFRKEL